jgi:cell division protein ZapA
MNHTFEIPCDAEEKVRLIEAATLLEDKLDQVPGLKGESKILMMALNLCYDYLQLKQDTTQQTHTLEERVEQIMHALATQSKTS